MELLDKTLVAWVAPAHLTQRGGSALTLENSSAHFDAIVYGEIEPGRWMAGSDSHLRSQRQQETWPAESSADDSFIQLAIAYRGREVSIVRNGVPYAHYTMENNPQPFSDRAHVLFGKRHLDVDGGESFIGRIADARIYDRALDGDAIDALIMGDAGAEPP